MNIKKKKRLELEIGTQNTEHSQAAKTGRRLTGCHTQKICLHSEEKVVCWHNFWWHAENNFKQIWQFILGNKCFSLFPDLFSQDGAMHIVYRKSSIRHEIEKTKAKNYVNQNFTVLISNGSVHEVIMLDGLAMSLHAVSDHDSPQLLSLVTIGSVLPLLNLPPTVPHPFT